MILHIALSISTPAAGVVGFVIQIRDVKKAASKNEKIQLRFTGNATSRYTLGWPYLCPVGIPVHWS